jgi:hypothetical protein
MTVAWITALAEAPTLDKEMMRLFPGVGEAPILLMRGDVASDHRVCAGADSSCLLYAVNYNPDGRNAQGQPGESLDGGAGLPPKNTARRTELVATQYDLVLRQRGVLVRFLLEQLYEYTFVDGGTPRRLYEQLARSYTAHDSSWEGNLPNPVGEAVTHILQNVAPQQSKQLDLELLPYIIQARSGVLGVASASRTITTCGTTTSPWRTSTRI